MISTHFIAWYFERSRTFSRFCIILKARLVNMDYLHQIKLSFTFYRRTFRFIDTNNLWRLLILPAIVNLIIAFLIIVFAIKTSGFIVDYILANFQLTSSDHSLHSLVEGFLMVVIRAFVFFLYLKVYRYLTLILLAPLLYIISSKVQLIDSGMPNTLCTSKFFMDCSRGIKIALRNFFIEITLSTLIIAISLLIAWIIPLAPLVILFLESYFMGYSMADYRNEYYNMNSRESRKLINSYFGLVIGNGLFFNIFLLIPVLGVLAAPAFALISSGLSINYLEKRKSILCNSNQSTLLMAES